MSKNTMSSDNIRKIDLEGMTEEQFEATMQKVTDKINKIVQVAISDANRLLNRYGLQVKMKFALEPMSEKEDRS